MKDLTIQDETGKKVPLNITADSIESNFTQLRELTDKGVFGGLRIVCDGMGGAAAGEVASSIAVVVVQQEILKHVQSGNISAEAIRKSIEVANRAIYAYTKRANNDAGTTIAATLTDNKGSTYVGLVGDARAYYMAQNGKITQIGRDHSLIADLALAQQIKPSEFYSHPQRNIITRSLGDKNNVTVDVETVQLIAGSKIVMTSDGVWEGIRRNITGDLLYAQNLPHIFAEIDQEFNATIPMFMQSLKAQGLSEHEARRQASQMALQIANGRIFREVNLYGLAPNASAAEIVRYLTQHYVGVISDDNTTAVCIENK